MYSAIDFVDCTVFPQLCRAVSSPRPYHTPQTPNPVLELEYLRPVNSNGRRLDRSIILHFLSMGEFVDAVMQDDFELGVSFGFWFSGGKKKQKTTRAVVSS